MNESVGPSLFGNLKDRDLAREGIVIGEGHFIAERMIDSGLDILSLLCTRQSEEKYVRKSAGRFPVHVADESAMSEIAGFRFHRGVLAAARRPALHAVPEIMGGRGVLFAVCPWIGESENIGGIIRSAAAFGFSGILLGEKSADPYSRKAVRVSMGTVFRLPVFRLADGDADIRSLKEMGITIVGAVAPGASASGMDSSGAWGRGPYAAGKVPGILTPAELGKCPGGHGTAVVLGNEASGVPELWLEACDSLVCIPMKSDVDSLNVCTAAGIIFHALSISCNT